MRRFAVIAGVCIVAWGVWAVVSLPPASRRLEPPAALPGEPPTVRGAYHIHSRASDGTGTIPEIAEAAARAGLQFIIVTDHGDALKRPAPPRYLSGVLCIEAAEISTTDGHYAALGLPPPPYPLGGEARDVVDDVARLGGFGIAAHPDSSKRSLQWHAWDAPIDAVEWFNADSQWRDEQRWRLLPVLLQYPMRPVETVVSLFDRPVGVLREWDRLTERLRVVGIAAADAHARMGLGGKADPYDEAVYVRAPSYEAVFRAFSTRAELERPLTGDAAGDARLVLHAFGAGRVYTTFDGLAGPASLAFSATAGQERGWQGEWMRGGEVRFVARANVPPGGSLVLLRNGAEVRRVAGGELTHDDTRPGAYRVEAHIDGAPGSPPLPWIVSNPIFVGREYAVSPEPAAPAPAVASMPMPAGTWRIEKEASSTGSFDTTAGEAAVSRRFTFQLGRQSASPFAALVTDEIGALHDATRLAFRAHASRPLRLSVQVRSRGDGGRRWQRSVYLDPTPRDIVVRFDDMRLAGTGERLALDPTAIASLLFVFDTTNARPGDGGTVIIDGLRTER